MATVSRNVVCSKEMIELGEGVAEFLKVLKEVLADGFHPGDDIPPILASAISDLLPALEGTELIGDELQDPETFVNSVYVGLSPIAFMFVPGNEEPE